MALEQEGKVVKIGNIEQVGEKFKKRTIVLDITKDPKYPKFAEFEFVQARVDVLDRVAVGDKVTVSFELEGREYKGKYYTSLRGWRVTGGTKAAPAGNEQTAGRFADEEIPF